MERYVVETSCLYFEVRDLQLRQRKRKDENILTNRD
jgi:hypothetical protein